MPTEKAQFRIDADTREAAAKVAALRAEVQALSGTSGAGARAADVFGGAMDKATDGIAKAEPVIGKTATAVSGLAGVMGGAGSQAAATTGAVANLAAAFTGGGGIAVAAAGAAAGIGYLIDGFTKAREEARKFEEATIESLDSVIDAMKGDIDDALGKLQERFDSLSGAESNPARVALEQAKISLDFQIDAGEEIAKAYELASAQAEAGLLNADKQVAALRQQGEAIVEVQDALEAKIETLAAQADEYDALKRKVDELEAAERAKEKAERERDSRRRKRMAEAAAAQRKEEQAQLAWNKKQEQLRLEAQRWELEQAEKEEKAAVDAIAKRNAHIDGLRKQRDEGRRKKEEALQKQMAADAVEAHKEMLARKEAAEAAAEAKRMERAQAEADAFSFIAGATLSTTNQLTGALITGQQEAIGQILASQVAAIGTQVQGIGVQGIAQGLVQNAALPGSGVPSMAIGAALIGVGTAMGGLGVAGQHLAAGGTIGQPLGGGAGKGGVNHGSFGRGGGVGSMSSRQSSAPTAAPTSVTTVYNFNGPTFDHNESANAVVRLGRRAESRLLEAER